MPRHSLLWITSLAALAVHTHGSTRGPAALLAELQRGADGDFHQEVRYRKNEYMY